MRAPHADPAATPGAHRALLPLQPRRASASRCSPRSSAAATEPVMPALMQAVARPAASAPRAASAVDGPGGHRRPVRGARHGRLHRPVRAGVGAPTGACCSCARRCSSACCDAAPGLFTRHTASSLTNTLVYEVQHGANLLVQALLTLVRDSLTLRRPARLPALAELEADADRRRARAGGGDGDAHRVPAPAPLTGPARRPPTSWPTWSRRTCSPGASCACTARSRRRASASPRQPPAAPADAQVGRRGAPR